jgi:GR25 family glycosyltransferase involved in LPS biosynthesis
MNITIKLIIILIIILVLVKFLEKTKELFSNISYNVISLGIHERLKNIKEQEVNNNIQINLVEAVDGRFINQNDLINKNILDINFKQISSKRNNEIGCYSSHLKIYKSIIDSNNDNGITVIFEDDFIINCDNFHQKINKIVDDLKDTNFDLVFLGNTDDNTGNYYKNDIYEINKNKKSLGTYGYFINNKNANKIYSLMNHIDLQIDEKINYLIINDKIKAYVVKPNIVTHRYDFDSSIK